MSEAIRQFINAVPDKRVALQLNGALDRMLPTNKNTAVTAGTTQTQAGATVLRSDCAYHDVTIVATASDGVALPYPKSGEFHFVKNSAATNAMKVYAVSPGTIDSTATATGVTQLAGDAVLYVCLTDGNYLRLGGVSATEVFTTITATTGNITTVNATSIDAGASGTAGSVDVFPATSARGKLILAAVNNDADTNVTLSNAAMGQATVISFPDPGAATANVVLTSAANDGVVVTATSAELNLNAGVTAGTSAPSRVLSVDAAESLAWATTDATQGETCTLTITDTRTGSGATGWAQKSELVSDVALGSYANAMYGLVTFGSSGAVTGLAAGLCGEVELSAGTTGGTYAAIEAELTANAEVSTGTDTGFIYANIAGSNGTGKTTVNTNGHFAILGTGVVNTQDGLFDEVSSQVATATARLRIKVGAAVWYIPLCANSALN